MSPEDFETYRRKRMCERKVPYESAVEALWAKEGMRKQGKLTEAMERQQLLQPYTCEYCGKVHLGHDNLNFHNKMFLTFVTTLGGVKKYERE